VPDRRLLIVLASLIGAMTLVSGLLLALEPRPVGPGNGISLNALEETRRPDDRLFDVAAIPPEQWQGIVIHDSGTLDGSARTLTAAHVKMGLGGLGYHFVIENARSGQDGSIVMGYRWRRQLQGVHTGGADGAWFNRHAISICLIADCDQQAPSEAQMQSLIWLVQRLQERLDVPRERVYVRTGTNPQQGSGRLFPDAELRRQLLIR
jgi:hypothetical protein